MEIKFKRYLQSFVFNAKEPLFEDDLKQTLDEEGYVIENSKEIKQGPLTIKNMKVAEKNTCSVVYNSEVGALFVTGANWQKVNSEFSNLKNILVTKLDVNIEEMIKSFELLSENQITTGKKPIDVINTYYKNCEERSNFTEIFGEECSFYVIRVVPKGKTQASANWYDLIIEPASTRSYALRLVYRNKDIQKFENIAANIEKNLFKIMEIVEG